MNGGTGVQGPQRGSPAGLLDPAREIHAQARVPQFERRRKRHGRE